MSNAARKPRPCRRRRYRNLCTEGLVIDARRIKICLISHLTGLRGQQRGHYSGSTAALLDGSRGPAGRDSESTELRKPGRKPAPNFFRAGIIPLVMAGATPSMPKPHRTVKQSVDFRHHYHAGRRRRHHLAPVMTRSPLRRVLVADADGGSTTWWTTDPRFPDRHQLAGNPSDPVIENVMACRRAFFGQDPLAFRLGTWNRYRRISD